VATTRAEGGRRSDLPYLTQVRVQIIEKNYERREDTTSETEGASVGGEEGSGKILKGRSGPRRPLMDPDDNFERPHTNLFTQVGGGSQTEKIISKKQCNGSTKKTPLRIQGRVGQAALYIELSRVGGSDLPEQGRRWGPSVGKSDAVDRRMGRPPPRGGDCSSEGAVGMRFFACSEAGEMSQFSFRF